MAAPSLEVFVKDYQDFRGYMEEVETAIEEANVYFSDSLRIAMKKAVTSAIEYDYDTSQYWSKVVKDRLWEELHSGHWQDVPMASRRLYALVMLLRGVVLTRTGKYKEALEAVDHGLLMGTPHEHLHVLGHLLTAKLVTNDKANQPQHSDGDTKRSVNIKFRNYSHFKETESESPHVKRSKLEDMTGEVFNLDLFSSKCTLLQTVYQPSLLTFLETFMKAETPVIIEGCLEEWPAFHKWKLVA